MRTLIWSLAASAAISLVALFLWSRVRVESTSGHDAVVVTRSTAKQGDRLAVGGTVAVNSPIAGDLAVAAADVDVSAPVQGYVMAAGRDVTIDAAVKDDVWAAGRNVTGHSDELTGHGCGDPLTGIGIVVDDVDAAAKELKANGVRFTLEPGPQLWGGYMAMFADPDGNVFYLDGAASP